MDIYTGKMKRIIVVVLTVSVAALVVSLQPFFLGYLDINTARLISFADCFRRAVFSDIAFPAELAPAAGSVQK